jgi:hypothetical protein
LTRLSVHPTGACACFDEGRLNGLIIFASHVMLLPLAKTSRVLSTSYREDGSIVCYFDLVFDS